MLFKGIGLESANKMSTSRYTNSDCAIVQA